MSSECPPRSHLNPSNRFQIGSDACQRRVICGFSCLLEKIFMRWSIELFGSPDPYGWHWFSERDWRHSLDTKTIGNYDNEYRLLVANRQCFLGVKRKNFEAWDRKAWLYRVFNLRECKELFQIQEDEVKFYRTKLMWYGQFLKSNVCKQWGWELFREYGNLR